MPRRRRAIGYEPQIDFGTPEVLSQTQVSLTIDGRAITVPAGTSVMRATALSGGSIPKLCASDNMAAFGSCRLCLVEIDGAKDKVFVGQPLELTLKIWVKPFQDKGRSLTLSEGDMWQMISETISWGSFTDRMNELAANNQRPGGQDPGGWSGA